MGTSVSTGTRRGKRENSTIRESGGVYTSLQTTEWQKFLETETIPFSIRIPLKYKKMYREFTHKQKYLFKLALIGLIEAVSKGKHGTQGPVVLNINIPISLAKAEANTMDPEVLVERINTLKFENRELKDIIRVHKRRIQELEAENRELLKTKKKYLDLKQKMQLWLTWLKKGYTNYVIKEIEKVIK